MQHDMEYPSGSKQPFPGFDRVYLAHDPGTPEFRAQMDMSLEGAFDVLRGDVKPAAPVSGRWMMGRRVPRDFIWTTLGVPVIVSDRVISILSAGEFLGWSTYPIDLVGPKGDPVSGYQGLVVRGRCGALQGERSTEIQKPGPVGNKIIVYRGQFFDETRWDGSHIFMSTDKTGLIFVLQEVRDALQGAKVKGIALDRTDTHERFFR